MTCFNIRFMRWVFLAASALLVACAGSPAVKDSSGKPIPVPLASFKLRQAEVQWEPHADYMVRGIVSARNKESLDVYSKKAAGDMEKMYSLLKTMAKDDLASALAGKGITKGSQQTIALRPLYGYYDQSGFGSGVVLQVSVVDHTTRQTWVHQVKADSGLQWVGATHAPEPDRTYVQGFVAGLVRIFGEASLIP